MTCWSLSNHFRAITHEQFVSLVTDFKQAAERNLDEEYALEITALKANKVVSKYPDEDIQNTLAEQNRRNLLIKADNLDQLTKDIWKSASYVEVKLAPKDTSDICSNQHFPQIEFKGKLPRQATFQVPSNDQSIKNEMISKYKRQLLGNGLQSHSCHSIMKPNSWF